MSEQTFLSVRQVVKGYRVGKEDVPVLRGVDLDIARGEFVALLGASGCGKTTLLNLLGTLEHPDQGEIFCDGVAYSSLSGRAQAHFRSEKIGFVFQSYQLIPELTVIDNVLIADGLGARPDFTARQRAVLLLEKLGLSHRLKHCPTELSGGEQQRTAIARALINNPTLILADEPTGNLDRHTGHGILEIFERFREQSPGTTIVMVTHDPAVAERADRIVRIADGSITA